jgi:hypothetical protein
VVFGHDRRQLQGTLLAKPLGADLRMIGIGPVTTREARPNA